MTSISSWLSRLNPIVYVCVAANGFELLHAQNNTTVRVSSTEPFSTPRLAIGNFEQAESTLRTGLRLLFPKIWISASPILVMHQLHLAEGGLSPIELQILREVNYGAGGRKVYSWQGRRLSSADVLSKEYEGNDTP